MKRVLWLMQVFYFYLFTLLVALLPSAISDRAGRLAGLVIMFLLPGRRKIAVDNINQALPHMKSSGNWTYPVDDPEVIAREVFINLGRSLVEVCRLYHGRGEDILRRIEFRGGEHYQEARGLGKGLVFLTGHCGNWELTALAFCRLFNDKMSVVARRQDNPYLNRMVEKMRMRYDNSVIYKQGALKAIISALKKKGVVGMLADQAVLPEEGTLIEVLGRTAWASKAPVVIAQKTGAPILPTFMHREGDRYVITINPPKKFSGDMSDEGVQQETRALSRYVEDFIIAHPTDWYWVHRRWKRAGAAVS